MDDFVWLLVSFVASFDVVFDLYAMLGGVFIKQRFFYERWQSFLLGGLVAVNFMVNIVVCCKLQQLQECCKVDFVS